MIRQHLIKWCVTLVLCLIGQMAAAGDTAVYGQGVTRADGPQLPTLSPGAAEVAKEIGLTKLIERLYQLPASENGTKGGTMSLEALSLRQQIMEMVVSTSLDIDGVIAEIDNENAKLSSVRADLESRRDRAQNINNIASIVTGGALGVVGTALQFSSKTANLGNAIGVGGGAASVILSVIGLRQQSGGMRALGTSPNMLAMLFDRKPEFHSEYPEDVWSYLNAEKPAEPGAGTRKTQLLEEWKRNGRIDKPETPKGQAKIAAMTSSISQQRKLSIDMISDRQAMLADVRAQVSLMKRDLSRLMLAIRSGGR